MSLGNWFLFGMGLEYLAAAGVFARSRDWGYALTMFAYGVANFGLLMAAR